MAKNLDGIKKLNPEDIKKYRKMVLSYIGEKDSSDVKQYKNTEPSNIRHKKIDGIKQNTGVFSETKGKVALGKLILEKNELSEAIKRQEEERKRIKEEEKQYKFKTAQADKDRRDQEERAEQEKIRQEYIEQDERERQLRAQAEKGRREQLEKIKQEEERKKEVAEQTRREAEEKRRVEKIKEQKEKAKLEEQKENETRRIKENSQLEKIKRREEIKRIKQEIKVTRQIAKEKRGLKRRKALRKYFKRLRRRLKETYFVVKKNLIYIIALLVLVLVIFYLIFCSLILRLRVDNVIVNRVAEIIPVPAVITSQGMIAYNDFLIIKNNSYLNLNLAEKQNYLTRWVILNNLRQKYDLTINTSPNDLASYFVLDKDFNQVGLSRINKISGLIKGGAELEQSGRYADEYNNGVNFDSKSAVEKFGPTVLKLAVGQISDIIPRLDGYFIVKMIGSKNNQFNLEYIFVKAQTLEQYLNLELPRAKVFILAN